MGSFLKKKANKQWICMDRHGCRNSPGVAFHVGDRSRTSTRKDSERFFQQPARPGRIRRWLYPTVNRLKEHCFVTGKLSAPAISRRLWLTILRMRCSLLRGDTER